jgi:uncharacterized membrane protein YccC
MKYTYHIYGALIGIACGFISAHTLFSHSYTALFFWGIVGLVAGWFTPHEEIRTMGFHYGFILILSFLLFNFGGTSKTLFEFVLLSLLFSIVGGLAGWLSVYVGYWIRKKLG